MKDSSIQRSSNITTEGGNHKRVKQNRMCNTHVYLFTHEEKKIQLSEREKIDIDNKYTYKLTLFC